MNGFKNTCFGWVAVIPRWVLTVTVVGLFATHVPANEAAVDGSSKPVAPRIQIAILLDVSGSMNGLIHQARSHLWEMVGQWAQASQGGAPATVEVALYRYGMQGHEALSNVERLLPFTRDLDAVSEALFRLTTEGSEEFCGAALQAALAELDWTDRPDDLRVILIAGNESFFQGDEPPVEACEDAIQRGIMVNTLFCGPEAQGRDLGWDQGPTRADGEYLAIDQNRKTKTVHAPQDALILSLNDRLNQTYVPFGPAGEKHVARQRAQDANAKKASRRAAIARTEFKATRGYQNSEWDLLDALLEGRVKLRELADKHFPAEMRAMTLDEKKAYMKGKFDERQNLRRRLAEVTGDRKRFIEAQLGGITHGRATLGEAVRAATRRQAIARRFQFGMDDDTGSVKSAAPSADAGTIEAAGPNGHP